MLQAIRSQAGSLVVKILFAVLIISFGVWGIADVFRQRTPAETTVAEVGNISIKADELQRNVNREMESLRRMFGGAVTSDQAKQLGVVDNVLQRMVSNDLLVLEERRLGLLVDDQVVRDAVYANPAFHNSSGSFDRSIFVSLLSENQLTEQRYVDLVRQDIERTILTSAVAGGATAPEALVGPLYRRQNEKRIADTVLVASDKMTGIPAPTEADLKTYYDKHQGDFRAPEYRGFTVLELTPADLAPKIDVPEDRLRKEYDARQGEFQAPEKRQIEQILVSDEAKAKEVEAQLAAGKDFAAVAKAVANQDADAIKLGWIVRKDMPQDLGNAAFSLAKGGTSKPIHDALGWHILRVTDIQPATTKPFAAVRDQLRTEVARDMAADQLFKERNDIEDALAGGATLDEVAAKFKMKKTVVPAVDLDGTDPKGGHAAVTNPDILHTAFNTEKGDTSRLIDMKDNGYFILRVDSVEPAAERPLADVHDKVKDLWLADKRKAAAEAEAKAISEAVGKGKSLAEVAAEKHLDVVTSPPVLRTGRSESGLPPEVIARIFGLKPKAAGVAEGPKGWYAVQLEKIEEPDPKADKAAMDELTAQTTKGIQSDILAEFDKALRGRYSVDIKRKEIDRTL